VAPETMAAVAELMIGPSPYAVIGGSALVGLFLAILAAPRPAPGRRCTASTSPGGPRLAPQGPRRDSLPKPPAYADTPRDQDANNVLSLDDNQEAPDSLARVLAGLADYLAHAGARCRPRVVQHSEQHTDIYLDRPSQQAPPGWTVRAEGSIWTRDRCAGDRCGDPSEVAAPLLVAIGQPDRDGQLYVDVETAGLTGLVGDRNHARRLACDIVIQVVRGPGPGAVRTIVVGDLIDALAVNDDSVTLADAWEDVQADVIAWVEQSHHALAVNSWANPFVGRGADPLHDALAPLLVVASLPPPAEVVRAIALHRPAALGVVTVGPVSGAASTIHCEPDTLRLIDVGLTCTPRTGEIDAQPAATRSQRDHARRSRSAIAASTIDGDETQPLPDAPPNAPTGPAGIWSECDRGGPRGDAALRGDSSPEILVRLLGDIRVDGGGPLRTKPTAVLAYIALHRSVSVEALEDACWADGHGEGLRKRLKDVMSECRAAVGSQHLPAATDGRYTVSPTVATDTQLFDLHLERAKDEPLDQQAHTYRSALDLVTGKVFTYPGRAVSSFGWIDTENLLSQWELKVERTALECIRAFTTIGDADQAAKVAVRALTALPLNTALTEALMYTHAHTGDLGAVETVYRAHADGLARIHDTSPDDSTNVIYRDLVQGRPR